MPARTIAKKIAGIFGVTLASRNHAAINFLKNPPATAFDLALLHSFPELRELTFLQVGANDGSRADPLKAYIDTHGWHGVMFEPMLENFSQLKRLHGLNPRLKLRRAAIDTKAGQRPLFNLDHEKHPALPDWSKGTGSFSRERLIEVTGQLGLQESDIISEEVDTVTWDAAWAELGSKPCDLLVLDTEGYDLTLLRSADLAAHLPRLIHFEHACVSLEERLEFYRYLLEIGYEISSEGPDTTAWRKA